MGMIANVVAVLFIIVAAPGFAQESDRVRQLERNFDLLKNTVVQQGSRIEALERELRGKSSASELNVSTKAQTQTAPSAGQPWHDRNAWGRVKNGMSEAQVVSILGRPTSVETVGSYKTIVFRGPVSGAVSVTGNVKLQDDRVWQVNTPVF
jgi:hypothetical protein